MYLFRMRSNKAFTLIELLITITLLSLVAVAVSVSLSGLGKHILQGAADKMVSDIRLAQQLAVSRHVSCGISFNPAGNSYFMYVGDTGTRVGDSLVRGRDLEIDYDTDKPYKGVDLVSTNFGDQLSFDYMGVPYDSTPAELASTGTITLSAGGSQAYVDISPNTGEVSVR